MDLSWYKVTAKLLHLIFSILIIASLYGGAFILLNPRLIFSPSFPTWFFIVHTCT